MLTSKGMRTIRSSRNIKSFRSCRHTTGTVNGRFDAKRIAREEERLAEREARRVWLAEQWNGHFVAAAGSLCALPPLARVARAL